MACIFVMGAVMRYVSGVRSEFGAFRKNRGNIRMNDVIYLVRTCYKEILDLTANWLYIRQGSNVDDVSPMEVSLLIKY